ncbi:VOC family protein [Kordiimonas aestuarii]|uniref:VOC family protein n=1 Tax=Kordiimonas aestuarii TaxID=1005925 RepID=UPI0021D2F30E|nr:VOC family protein [Kordiimonas aestuarii]
MTSVPRQRFSRYLDLTLVLNKGTLALLEDAGGFVLVLSQSAGGKAVVYPGGFHIGFNMDSEAHMRAIHERLTTSGVAICRLLGSINGALTFQCNGPDGMVVEFAHR